MAGKRQAAVPLQNIVEHPAGLKTCQVASALGWPVVLHVVTIAQKRHSRHGRELATWAARPFRPKQLFLYPLELGTSCLVSKAPRILNRIGGDARPKKGVYKQSGLRKACKKNMFCTILAGVKKAQGYLGSGFDT